MSKLYQKIAKISGGLCAIMIFALAGLTFLHNQLNFDIPASNKVRDAAGFAHAFEETEKLDLREISADIATNFTPYVPVTYSYYGGSSSSQSSSFHIAEPTPVSDPSVDAGYGVMRYVGPYGSHFLYAHSTRAFSPIKWLYVGSTFTATIDGATATYRVSGRYVFNKSSELNGSANNSRRTRIYASKDENGTPHSLSLMTCGNGSNDDPNYRLVLFADQI